MTIADRIQYLRKQKGYSQEELADKVGVSSVNCNLRFHTRHLRLL